MRRSLHLRLAIGFGRSGWKKTAAAEAVADARYGLREWRRGCCRGLCARNSGPDSRASVFGRCALSARVWVGFVCRFVSIPCGGILSLLLLFCCRRGSEELVVLVSMLIWMAVVVSLSERGF